MSSERLKRWAPFLVAGALQLLAVALALSNLRLSPVSGAIGGVGTDLDGTPAPDFHLVDQTGQPVALSDLRGKVVVLTFLYTHCPDTCPLMASKLGQVHDQLGEQAQGVAFVAVTVDPERDTPAQVQQFLAARQVTDKLIFLTGNRPALEAVWQAYHIGVTRGPTRPSLSGGLADYDVTHNAVLYLIDKQGRERRLMSEDFTIRDILADIERLAQ